MDLDDPEVTFYMGHPFPAYGDPDMAWVLLKRPLGIEDSDLVGPITIDFPENINAYRNMDRTGGIANHYDVNIADFNGLESMDFFLEGKEASQGILDTVVKTQMTLNRASAKAGSNIVCRDELRYTVIKLDLLVNNTESETDDYVVKQKTEDIREIPMNTPAGATDNHIPMKIHLEGPEGFSCLVKLSDTGQGDIEIKNTDGSNYSSDGETVTVGTDYEVYIYGVSESSDINDVKIRADIIINGKTIFSLYEDLTVIWISNTSFRGSAQQGQSLTYCSTAKYTNYQNWRENKVGKFIYHNPANRFPPFDVVKYQMEITHQIYPDDVISNVQWDLKSETSRAGWGPGSGTLTPQYKGQNNWEADSPESDSKDIIQETTCLNLFTIDGPGYGDNDIGLPYTENYRLTYKGKFREWVEIKIGENWFVCSPYKEWRTIIHIKYQDDAAGWVEDTNKTNEVVEGTISGFAGTWSED